ncbi:cleft lip and palate transmembrane protein 1-like protein [Drosophila grimshawi]|uniref:Lipid scramblase CLPTM1L n=1 Tax=Drosophila grimshawi TaxID=7222 RepID=B4JNL7_DROGR|nr:cleft lip and palate transmembrane protein 1-like protein [Drosophila grimshawi]EDV92310.1 GH24845 [Drosophila grimshawi]
MAMPSISTLVGVAFLAYILHSIYQMSQLFTTLQCSDSPCYTSFLADRPRMQLALFSSINRNPIASEVHDIYKEKRFDYWRQFDHDFQLDVPLKTRRNGSLYLHVVLALEGEPLEWRTLRRDGPTVLHTLNLCDYMVPRAEAFNLLGDTEKQSAPLTKKSKKAAAASSTTTTSASKPITHIRSNVYVTLLTDLFSLSQADVPPEMAQLIRVNRMQQILPILQTDSFNTRLKDLVAVRSNLTEFTFSFHYKPVGVGKLRLMLLMEHATQALLTIGFATKDIDEVKGIFSDTNVYLLCGTIFISSVHMLFDFLSFKNDVSFWRKKQSYEGLSTRTTVWRAFSQFVIFLYLLDEETSYLVLVPVGLGTLIELWKCKKILRLDLSFSSLINRKLEEVDQRNGNGNTNTNTNPNANAKTKGQLAEQQTQQFDREGMRYLSYLLYPLCLGGAIYSLLYQPHRSWYSWTLNSLVNGVYAFGFLFMLPQLFVNYKLKSVAALPWRAFMYKAFNTFIDDFFAFIITMPTAHRVACLRDDIVFLIYLYQRWLYPVDKTRLDTGAAISETPSQAVAGGASTATAAATRSKKRD